MSNYYIMEKLQKDRQMLIGVTVLSAFVFVFFACMIAFIGNATSCFTKNGNVMSKTDYDFYVAGNLIGSLGLVGSLISLIMCGKVVGG